MRQIRARSSDAQRLRRVVLAVERQIGDDVGSRTGRQPFPRVPNPIFGVKVTISGGSAGSESATCSYTYDVTNRAGDVLLGEDLTPLWDRLENIEYRATPAGSDGLAFFDADGSLKLLWADELPAVETCDTDGGAGVVITNPTATADNVIIAGAAGVTPLTLQGAASQTAKLLDIQDSSAASLASVNAAGQWVSSLATGTAPLSVASTTLVANLNADKLDGLEGAALIVLAPANSARNVITGPDAATNVLDLVQGSGGLTSTNTLFRVKDSSGVAFLQVVSVDGSSFGAGTWLGYQLVLTNNKPLLFAEATGNGTNKISMLGPASLSADKTITLPAVTGTGVVASTTSTNTAHAYFADGTAGGATCRALASSDLPIGTAWTMLVQASNETRTNSTFTDAATLQLSGLASGATYEFEALMVFNASVTCGVKVQIIDNDGILATPSVAAIALSSGSNTTRAGQGDIAGGNTSASMASVATAQCLIKGFLTTSSAGQVYIQWAQQSTNASALSLLAGSFLKVRRVS